MRYITFCLITVFLVIVPIQTILAIDCSQLNTDPKIKEFVKKTKESNPLMRKKLSAKLLITKVEGKVCAKKPSKSWVKKVSTVHSLRIDESKRTFFIKGKDSPMCLVKKGTSEFKCSECGPTINEQCRSHSSSKSTAIRDTNIDTADMEALEDEHHSNVCQNFKKKYIKIIATKISGDSPYEKIVSFYEKKREILIKSNYYYQGNLTKVYRFYPKKYVNIDNEWLSTKTRVRTVCSKEKSYSYETKVEVLKKKNGKYDLFKLPKKDPYLRKTGTNILFSTSN